eukprot:7311799-Prymnesium_polylepis.1
MAVDPFMAGLHDRPALLAHDRRLHVLRDRVGPHRVLQCAAQPVCAQSPPHPRTPTARRVRSLRAVPIYAVDRLGATRGAGTRLVSWVRPLP